MANEELQTVSDELLLEIYTSTLLLQQFHLEKGLRGYAEYYEIRFRIIREEILRRMRQWNSTKNL